MERASTACYALTPGGALLAHRVAALLHDQGGAHIYLTPPLLEEHGQEGDRACESLPLLLTETFHQYKAHIFVTATGIAVRCISPHLTHKSQDPAVVVCDETGRFAVSLLSGHWGGGNHLAQHLAEGLDATAVITTATDCRELPAVDVLAQEAGCLVVDWHNIKRVNAALLRGEKVLLHDPLHMLGNAPDTYFVRTEGKVSANNSSLTVAVDWHHMPPADNLLRLAVPALHVGVGCRKGVAAPDIVQAIRQSLHEAGLEMKAVAGLASVTAKQEEPGLLEAAQNLSLPITFYSPEELADAPTLSPSAMAAQIFGVEHISVAEGAALLSAGGEDAALILPKVKHGEKITVAVALAEYFHSATE